MKIVFTSHAKKRIKERNLNQTQVINFIQNPDSSTISSKNNQRTLIKKVYYHQTFKKKHLLIAICEQQNGILHVITIIDTSKVKKYS